MNKPLRIGFVLKAQHGLGETYYIKNIIAALLEIKEETDKAFEIFLISDKQLPPGLYDEFKALLHEDYIYDRIKQGNLFIKLLSCLLQYFPKSDYFFRELRLRIANVDFAFPYVPKYFPVSFRHIGWLPDLQHKVLPEFFTAEELVNRENAYIEIIKKSPKVLLSSQSAAADFKTHYPQYLHKVEILPFRVLPSSDWYTQDPQTIQQKHALPERFFMINNQFWKHKNHLLVFEALRLLHQQKIYPNIVCTGHLSDVRSPEYIQTVLEIAQQSVLSKQIYILGVLPRHEQIQILRKSIAVIQPSLFEGWSTCVEEARILGKDIILSDLPVHKEQNPEYGVFYDRHSAEDLATKMAEFWNLLESGPNIEREEARREPNQRDTRDFAQDFLKLAIG